MSDYSATDTLDEAALDEALTRQVKAEQQLSVDLDGYVGKWVAVREHQVVASEKTLERLLDIMPDDVDAIVEVSERVGTAAYY
jgi:Family of unknown function (DUF5678)